MDCEAVGPRTVLHIHWLDKTFEPTLGTSPGVDFPDRAMAADFAFDLYAALHGFGGAIGGFLLKDASGHIVGEWRAGHEGETGQTAAASRSGAASASDAVAAGLAVVGRRSRRTRRAWASPLSPLVYRPLAAALALLAILSHIEIANTTAGAALRTASADMGGRGASPAEGRSVYLTPAPAAAQETSPSKRHRHVSPHDRWLGR